MKAVDRFVCKHSSIAVIPKMEEERAVLGWKPLIGSKEASDHVKPVSLPDFLYFTFVS